MADEIDRIRERRVANLFAWRDRVGPHTDDTVAPVFVVDVLALLAEIDRLRAEVPRLCAACLFENCMCQVPCADRVSPNEVALMEERDRLRGVVEAADAHIDALEDDLGPCTASHNGEACYECHLSGLSRDHIRKTRAALDKARQSIGVKP